MSKKYSYDQDELIACARGELFGPGNPQLPLPPLLMINRIVEISESAGDYGKGMLVAEFDIRPDLWFFEYHFVADPVMPGCLGMDALWQLLGFFLGWSGATGRGRALGCAEIKFSAPVTPATKLLTYRVDVRRIMTRNLVLGIADGCMIADGVTVYTAKNLRVGLFSNT